MSKSREEEKKRRELDNEVLFVTRGGQGTELRAANAAMPSLKIEFDKPDMSFIFKVL